MIGENETPCDDWIFQTDPLGTTDPNIIMQTYDHGTQKICAFPDGTFIMAGLYHGNSKDRWPITLSKANQILGPAATTWPEPDQLIFIDKKMTDNANARRKTPLQNPKGFTEANASVGRISTLLRRNGFTSEEQRTSPKTGKQFYIRIQAWAPPNGQTTWIQKGFGTTANWRIQYIALLSSLLSPAQSLAKLKALSRGIWTHAQCHQAPTPENPQTCRLCGMCMETQEHFMVCEEIQDTFTPLFKFAGHVLKSNITMTPSHILLGLDEHGAHLPGAINALHALVMKTAIWKFTAQVMDPEKPIYQPLLTFRIAVKALAVSIYALQQRVAASTVRKPTTGKADKGGDWRVGRPLITGRKGLLLILEKNFYTLLLNVDIDQFKDNPWTDARKYRSPRDPSRKRNKKG